MSAETDEETIPRGGIQQPMWYPGKFVGLPNRRLSKTQPKPVDAIEQPRPEKSDAISAFLGVDATDAIDKQEKELSGRNSTGGVFKKKWFGGKNKQDDDASSKKLELKSDDEDPAEEMRKESMIARTVRGIRDKFVSRKLVGRIYIYRMSGVVSTAVTTKVGLHDKKSEISDDFDDLPYYNKRALGITDIILTSLERRSRAWEGVDFADEVLLTRGATFGVSDPFFGAIGFSLTIELSATVTTLLASYKRFEEYTALQEPRGSFSFLRSMSFSGVASPSMKSSTSTNKLDSSGQVATSQGIIFSVGDKDDKDGYTDAQRQLKATLNSKLYDKRLETSNGWFIHDGTLSSHDAGGI